LTITVMITVPKNTHWMNLLMHVEKIIFTR